MLVLTNVILQQHKRFGIYDSASNGDDNGSNTQITGPSNESGDASPETPAEKKEKKEGQDDQDHIQNVGFFFVIGVGRRHELVSFVCLFLLVRHFLTMHQVEFIIIIITIINITTRIAIAEVL